MGFRTRLAAVLSLLLGCSQAPQQAPPPAFEPTWESLISHQVPEWLIDAKFGIYAHWGVYSVPAYGNEWYAKEMYDPANRRNIFAHHNEVYGGPAKFGYRKFIPQFKAEKFDPAAWADVIKRSGGRYAGIAAVHHDGFLLWDSAVNRWNAANMGPKRDLYGDLVQAVRAEGLKTIATFHHIRTFNWYLPRNKEDVEEGRAESWDVFDPEYSDLYWNEYVAKQEDFIAEWRAKVTEVIDKYGPDVVWFDGGLFQDEAAVQPVRELLAHYYNQAAANGREVDVLNKLPTSKKFNFPREFGVLTFEAGRDRPDVVERPWIDDLSIAVGSWGYVEGLTYRDANRMIDGMCDRVARNGGLLLSLAPKADGTLPEKQVEFLLEMGGWLAQNGEAIYGTRPWKIQAEGPADKFVSMQNDHRRWNFEGADAGDIRFTRKGGTLYAIALGWPEKGRLTIKSLGSDTKIGAEGIASVTLLGSDDELKWSREQGGLTIALPEEKPNEYAYAFKVEPKGKLDVD